VIASGNSVKLTSSTVIRFLEGLYDNKSLDDSLREFSEANSTHGDKPFTGFL
jgi:hypothetical protein